MKAILFDLDGTLLSLDFNKFFTRYMEDLCEYLSEFINRDQLKDDIIASVYVAVDDTNAGRTVEDAFSQEFIRRRGGDWAALKPLLDRYYLERFDLLGDLAQQIPQIPEMIKSLKARGYQLIIATNAVFPRQAILCRLGWAGLDAADFTFIADYESMHYCKPHLRFYREILDRVGLFPEDCAMVGNNAVEDMVPRKLGMPTYFITDEAIYNGVTPDCDWKGDRGEFIQLMMDLPPCR